LHNTGKDGNGIVEAFGVVSVEPVEDVKGTIGTKSKQIMTSNRLGLASLAHHKQLWKNGNGFQVNRKCPQNLKFERGII